MKHFFRWLSVIFVFVFFYNTTAAKAGAFNPAPEPASVSEDAYWALVQKTKDALPALDNQSAEEVKKKLSDIASEFESITDVDMNGQTIHVNNGYLIRLLRADSPSLEKINGVLSNLLSAHKDDPGQVFSTADLEPLHEILLRPEFTWAEKAPNPINEWLQKLWETFNQWLNKMLGGNTITISGDSTCATTIASVLLAVVLVFVFRTLFIDFTKEAQINGEEDGGSEPLTSEAAFDKAQQLSRGGDYRSAVRYLYISSLLLMDERGVLRYDRSKTNREYLRSVSNSPELAKPLSEVIEVFDNVWYGYHTLEEDTFKIYSDRVEELKDKKV